uniref:Uncharacterized protein n=1 Tax=Glossina brevipalpis TaxID=37001 RepID=A0A1A9VZV5_9MUSC
MFSLVLSLESLERSACNEKPPSTVDEHFPGICEAQGGGMWCTAGCQQMEYDYGL